MIFVTHADAIDKLYRTYASTVLRRARAILRDEEDAQEILQEVFATLLQRPDVVARLDSPMTFFYRTTTNRCLNRIRNADNRARLLQQHGAASDGERTGPDPEASVVLADLLRSLPEEVAQVLVYAVVDGMTHLEIAEIVGCSRRHIGNLLARIEGLAAHEGDELR